MFEHFLQLDRAFFDDAISIMEKEIASDILNQLFSRSIETTVTIDSSFKSSYV